VVVLGGHPDYDTKGLHDLGPNLRGKARVLVEDNAEREPVDVEDSTVEFLKDLLRGGRVLDRDQMGVAGKGVYNHHD